MDGPTYLILLYLAFMTDMSTPADTNLDRLWWNWQQVDPDNRTYDIGIVENVPTYEYMMQNNFTYPYTLLAYSGDPTNVTTLNHTLWMAGVLPNATIGDVMDLGGDTICAEYIE